MKKFKQVSGNMFKYYDQIGKSHVAKLTDSEVLTNGDVMYKFDVWLWSNNEPRDFFAGHEAIEWLPENKVTPPKSKNTLSVTLMAVLEYIKNNNNLSVNGLNDVIMPLYGYHMKMIDIIMILLKVYIEAQNEPRFEMPGRLNWVENILLAPVSGWNSIELFGPNSKDMKYTVEQFYGAMVIKMLNDLKYSRKDWIEWESDES